MGARSLTPPQFSYKSTTPFLTLPASSTPPRSPPRAPPSGPDRRGPARWSPPRTRGRRRRPAGPPAALVAHRPDVRALRADQGGYLAHRPGRVVDPDGKFDQLVTFHEGVTTSFSVVTSMLPPQSSGTTVSPARSSSSRASSFKGWPPRSRPRPLDHLFRALQEAESRRPRRRRSRRPRRRGALSTGRR